MKVLARGSGCCGHGCVIGAATVLALVKEEGKKGKVKKQNGKDGGN